MSNATTPPSPDVTSIESGSPDSAPNSAALNDSTSHDVAATHRAQRPRWQLVALPLVLLAVLAAVTGVALTSESIPAEPLADLAAGAPDPPSMPSTDDAGREERAAIAEQEAIAADVERSERLDAELEAARRLRSDGTAMGGDRWMSEDHPPGDRVELQLDPEARAAVSLDDLWDQARELRRRGSFQGLDLVLRRILARDPSDARARRWQTRLPDWRRRHGAERVDALSRHLESLARALSAGDLDRALGHWRRPDDATREALIDVIQGHRYRRVQTRILDAELDGDQVVFRALILIEGRNERRRDLRDRRAVSLEQRRFAGKWIRGGFVGSFPG
ncbi:MAG: hypothetical protein AAGN46_11070 [Acidobacteriota bacterium]